ncbi:hypothetical protein CAPI_05400 [Corynebacterium capitovis DSM 44611]|uniref:polyprenol phosphomannose-dependent alpha 1,6 mannosyltransferase MptB n=1 Tax=Corynebacterium capitovis TaxID=131081 RepID=UPI0003A6AB00|nr:polyprenol phosphomannose-dependent alpha 1,6 mannosyltransferase MptB [Corynebacterium capitovis]WKD57631.1 hypothetical protein CAPI_05400 [Corynebacterium capitovis DSM 44611]
MSFPRRRLAALPLWILPRLGRPGSRSSELHAREEDPQAAPQPSTSELNRFSLLRWLGAVGTLLMGLGGLGGGALPVVGNPYFTLPGGAFMGRMLQASSALVLIGVGLLVTAWVCMGPFLGVSRGHPRVRSGVIVQTWAVWVLPLLFTAPLFTQDIYSYLAQGSIVRHGLDPYAAGPVELLGTENHLARSVPFIWAHSPSPYGPVALGLAGAVSRLTGDSLVLGVLAHRALALVGIASAAWAIIALARRCSVAPATALWLGVLNPLTLLHLVGGIHNESLLLGVVLVGLEVGLRAIEAGSKVRRFGMLCASGFLISCGGMVKVTGFIGLGFVGMALARALRSKYGRAAIPLAAFIMLAVLVLSVAVVSAATGIGLGWVTSQGGAATIRSWMSLTTVIGVSAGFFGMVLGLGDHTEAMLTVTRGAGLTLAGAFLIRMLWATFRGSIHPVGGLGVATLVLVVLFPVVHPWYPLWALLPLAAWANRFGFRAAVVVYSAAFSFFVLPRGLALSPGAVATIYFSAAVYFALLCGLAWLVYRRWGRRGLH